jgi:integrase
VAKRRGNGEGSIYRRKDGLWVGQYKVQTPSGTKTKYIYSKIRKDAAKGLADAIANRDKGIVFDSEGLSLEEHFSRWLASVEGTIRPRAYLRYEQCCRLHIVPTLGNTKLHKLRAMQLQSLYGEKLRSGLSPRTVQIIHATLNKALKQAVAWLLIPSNPAEFATPPRSSIREMTPLSKEQVAVFLEAARGNKLEALYVLAITTGMRQGELLGLQWKDIDFDPGMVRVRRTVYNGQVQAPKTKKSKRSITLTKEALTALMHHESASDWVFSTRTGNTITCQNLNHRSFKPLLRKSGLPDIRFHDLRHTCATLLLTKGVHPKIVQEMLGHSTISITLDTYSHVLPNMQGEAVRAMEDIFSDDD